MFDPLNEAKPISKSITTVLENQCVEWVKSGVNSEECYVACIIGLANALYDVFMNASATKMIQEGKVNSLSEYTNVIKNGNKDFLDLRNKILDTAISMYKA